MKVDVTELLKAKGYRIIDGQWYGPGRWAEVNDLAPAAGHKPNPEHEPLAAPARKVADPVRRFVRVTSYRCRLVDRDALWVKYVIDALRYAGVLFEDTPHWLEIEVHQTQVSDKRNERTELVIR